MKHCAGVLAGLVLALAGLVTTEARADDFVGDATCLRCHADLEAAYAETVHARVLGSERGRDAHAEKGCESCHGPGAAHARSGGSDHTASGWLRFGEAGHAAGEASDAACMSCHRSDGLRFWAAGPHESAGLSCESCHQVMSKVSERSLLAKEDEAAVCRTCHRLPQSALQRSSHMPARGRSGAHGGEGFMSCGSCHDPHGSIADGLIDAHTVNESCLGCHAEKRGPFLWEHAPVTENCLACHVPHGSLQPDMLQVSGPRLCQSCHVAALHPSEARLSGSRFVRGKSCMNCHPKVHGSNHPSGAFFTR